VHGVQKERSFLVAGGCLAADAVRVIGLQEGFPHATVPTVFADGVANIGPSTNVVKFYLFRTDPDQTGKNEYKNQIIAQIVMPTLGFLHMALFFEKAVKHFVAQGTLPADLVENLRKNEGL
jgi:hypothetical protein